MNPVPAGLSDLAQRMATVRARFGQSSAPVSIRSAATSPLPEDTQFQTLMQSIGSSTVTDGASLGATSTMAELLAGAAAAGESAPGTTVLAAGDAVVATAQKYQGIPYVWGGSDPNVGFDCSGLVQHSFSELGVDLPRLSRDQARVGSPVGSLAEAQPGDLVAFGDPVDHIGIYAGDGKMVVAPRRGETVMMQSIVATPTSIRRVLTDPSALVAVATSVVGQTPAIKLPTGSGLEVARPYTVNAGYSATPVLPAIASGGPGVRVIAVTAEGALMASEPTSTTATTTPAASVPGTVVAHPVVVRADAVATPPATRADTPTTTSPTITSPTTTSPATTSAATGLANPSVIVVPPPGSPLIPTTMTSTANTNYSALFAAAGAKHGVAPELLAAVASVESSFNPHAVSPAGAQGLMQIMPATAAALKVNPFVPAEAIDGAARLLAENMKRFGSVELALAAYNAGPGAVEQHKGIPPFKETQDYVVKVMARVGAPGAFVQPKAGDWGPNTQMNVVSIGGSNTRSWRELGYLAPATSADVTKALGTANGPVAMGILKMLQNATTAQLTSTEFMKTLNDINRDTLGLPAAPDILSLLRQPTTTAALTGPTTSLAQLLATANAPANLALGAAAASSSVPGAGIPGFASSLTTSVPGAVPVLSTPVTTVRSLVADDSLLSDPIV